MNRKAGMLALLLALSLTACGRGGNETVPQPKPEQNVPNTMEEPMEEPFTDTEYDADEEGRVEENEADNLTPEYDRDPYEPVVPEGNGDYDGPVHGVDPDGPDSVGEAVDDAVEGARSMTRKAAQSVERGAERARQSMKNERTR